MTASLIINKKITFAFCTYNRADRLEKLVAAMRSQHCDIPFEILAVNNNSQDNTLEVLQQLAEQPGVPLRFVTETVQGIVAARNRAIEEAMNSSILVFIDDDEIPLPGLLAAASYSIFTEGAQCVGGRVEMDFSDYSRPSWLEDELLGFLAATDYGNESFWIKEASTPIWTANIAYDMNIFINSPELRFDKRYDRKGNVIGGGSDAVMFRNLLDRKISIRYNPDMAVLHDVEPWRLKCRYFLRLHFRSGLRRGRYELPSYPRALFGVPLFLVGQCFQHCLKTLTMLLSGRPGMIRQAMNMTHACGMICGSFLKFIQK